jgi:hypothetical protein
MKTLALLSICLALPLCAQTQPAGSSPAGASAADKTVPSLNQLKLQVSNLALQNAQLAAHVEGLQKELESTRSQLVQVQTNAVISEICSGAGIAPKECSIAPDGTAGKVAPAPAKPPEEPAKPAAPPKP